MRLAESARPFYRRHASAGRLHQRGSRVLRAVGMYHGILAQMVVHAREIAADLRRQHVDSVLLVGDLRVGHS